MSPAFGPLAGNITITITGTGFTFDGAEPNKVVVAGQEAILASAIDDNTLEVVVPPGTAAGDAPIFIYNQNGHVTTNGKFAYTALPTITQVTPRDIVYDSLTTKVTVSGSGFMDQGAGEVTVNVAGAPAVDVVVNSDSELTFTATPGVPLSLHDLEIVDGRGAVTKSNAIRYVPSLAKGFLMFSKSPATFAWFYDPVGKQLVRIPNSPDRVPTSRPGYRALVVDAAGQYWAHSRDSLFGKIDFQTQSFDTPIPIGARVNAFVRKGAEIFAITHNGRFGKVDLETGSFTLIGSATIDCCGFGLALLNGTMYAASESGISTIDPVTGLRGALVPMSPSYHFADMRELDGVLYGVTRYGQLVSIDPTNGISSLVQDFGVEVSAMETFQ
ncbi:MAG: IPT/TIG domain-containing protein [Deltaproteobacteria bacterium]|nr:IPT/TIG domain-containing protein [Deltaproteobacteria bacterium]